MSNVEYEKVNRAYEITEFKDRVAEKYNIIDVSESKWFLNINFISFEDLHFLFKILDRPIQNSIIFDLTGKSLSVEHFNTNIRNVKKLRNKLAHIENLTIIVNKQLITESHEYIVKGKRVFTTIKFIYETIEERINTKLTNKLEKNYEIRVEKYKNIGLYT
jgi:hypothetical protein